MCGDYFYKKGSKEHFGSQLIRTKMTFFQKGAEVTPLHTSKINKLEVGEDTETES